MSTDGVQNEQTAAEAMIYEDCAYFDGEKDYVELPYDSGYNPPEFTLICRVKCMGKRGVWRSVAASTTPKRGYMLYAGDNDDWQFWIGSENQWTKLTGPLISNNMWTHLAAVYSNGTAKLYVNGALADEQPGKYSPADHPFRIGAGDADVEPKFLFKGKIADARVYNKSLSAKEIHR